MSWISVRSVTSLPLSLSDHEPESYYCLLSVNKSFPRSQPFTLKWASHAPPRLTPDFDTFHPWHDLLTGKWCHRQCEAGFLEARSLLMKCNEGNPARARTRVVNKTWALFPAELPCSSRQWASELSNVEDLCLCSGVIETLSVRPHGLYLLYSPTGPPRCFPYIPPSYVHPDNLPSFTVFHQLTLLLVLQLFFSTF